MATLFVLVGLPAAGETTAARPLAEEHAALRLAPDEWVLPLLGDADAGGERDVLEGRTAALQLLDLGTDVVLDLGCWARDERSAVLPRAGWDDWPGWAQERWPSLDVD